VACVSLARRWQLGSVQAKEVALSIDTEGPVSKAMVDRPPFGPIERLDPARLREEQEATLRSPRRKASFAARCLFAVMDLVYGKARTLEKFRVLELVARVPYQAWENVAYVAVTHTAREPGFARRVFDRVRVNRWEQDNEQWHLLIMEELVAQHPEGSWLRNRVVPQVLAFGYYQWSWLTYAIKPEWSYRLNADFEDHAEHEYALMVQEHPEWETTLFHSDFAGDFGSYDSLADLFRQIGYDERLHKLQSEAAMAAPRFT
jgi:ubiquinol oxidase